MLLAVEGLLVVTQNLASLTTPASCGVQHAGPHDIWKQHVRDVRECRRQMNINEIMHYQTVAMKNLLTVEYDSR